MQVNDLSFLTTYPWVEGLLAIHCSLDYSTIITQKVAFGRVKWESAATFTVYEHMI